MSRSLKIVLFVFIVIATGCWRYTGWNSTLGFYIEYLYYIWLAFIVITLSRSRTKQQPMRKIIIALAIVPLLSLITHFTEETKDLFYHKAIWFHSLAFLFYYVFHQRRCSEREIIKFLLIVGSVTFIIQIVQQGIPNYSVFGVIGEDNGSLESAMRTLEKRNGLYRFRLGTYCLTLFCMYFCWQQFIVKKTIKAFALFAVFFVSMYLFLTRQLMFASIISIAFTSFFAKGNSAKRLGMLLLVSVFLFILYQYADVLLGDMITNTKEETNDNNIRVLAFEFYWEQILHSPMSIVLGNGYPSALKEWEEYLHLYTGDIGIVGQWFHYGVIWVALYVWLLFKVLFKYAKLLPLYVKLFVFGTFVNCIMIMPYYNAFCYVIWAAMLYICDLHITKSDLRIQDYSKCKL